MDMNGLKDLKIGTRLSLVLACVLVALAAVAGAGLWGLGAVSNASQHALAQDVQLAQQALEIQTLVLLERRYEKDAFINLAEADKRVAYVKKWTETRARMVEALAKLRKLDLTPEDAQAAEAMARHFDRYAAGFEATMAMVQRGELATTQAANTELGKYKGDVQGMESTSEKINDHAAERAQAVAPLIAATQARGQACSSASRRSPSCWPSGCACGSRARSPCRWRMRSPSPRPWRAATSARASAPPRKTRSASCWVPSVA